MKKRIISMLLVAAMTLSFVSCRGAGTSSSVASSGAVGDEQAEQITINVMWQQEVTETFMVEAIKKLEAKYPNVKVNLNVSPQAYSEITNLLATNNAPDIFFSWHSDVDYYGMMKEGLLYPVNDILALDTAEGGEKLSDRISKIGVEQGEYEGKNYLLPLTQYLAANFYNAAAFKDSKVKLELDTIENFEKTCAAIKAEGIIDPIVYAGVYSFMVMDAMIFPMIYTKDSKAADAINAGEPGAWKSAAALEAVKKWEGLVKAGYVTTNSLAMDHIQSQMELINGKAAFAPVGTWLEGEMAGQWPDGFELTPFFAPTLGGTKPATVAIMEYMILPKQKDDTKLKYVGELMQEFYSLSYAEKCLDETGALMALEEIPDSMAQKLPQSYKKALELLKTADSTVPAYKIENKEVMAETFNVVNALTSGEIDAEEFCNRLDAASQK